MVLAHGPTETPLCLCGAISVYMGEQMKTLIPIIGVLSFVIMLGSIVVALWSPWWEISLRVLGTAFIVFLACVILD